jgi:hypothetical protein
MIYFQLAALVLALVPGLACRETSRADAAQIREVQKERQKQFAERLAKADANPDSAD